MNEPAPTLLEMKLLETQLDGYYAKIKELEGRLDSLVTLGRLAYVTLQRIATVPGVGEKISEAEARGCLHAIAEECGDAEKVLGAFAPGVVEKQSQKCGKQFLAGAIVGIKSCALTVGHEGSCANHE
jgi:hypothetical protein